MFTRFLLRLGRFPGADTFLSFIGRRILGAFSLIRTAILVMGVANVLLFQYLDYAEAQERTKLAEQGKLEHLSFVVQTQIQSYENAVWQTGRLPGTISSARDLYTAEATSDLQDLRTLNRSLLAPGGALHDFTSSYLRLNQLWQAIVPTIEQGGDLNSLRVLWTNQQGLVSNTPKEVDDYRQQAQQDLVGLQHDKENAKRAATAVSILISLISFALSIALAVVLTRQIVPPVTRLRNALEQVASGDLSPRAQVKGKDEISELLGTFNSAIARLHTLLVAVQGHALGISAESRRLREAYSDGAPDVNARASLQPPLSQLEQLADVTAEVAARSQTTDGAVSESEGTIATVAGINQLISQVAEVAGSASLLAESARQAAEAAPRDDPNFAQLSSNLRGLDAEAKQMAEQLRTLSEAIQNAQSRMAESMVNLDRAAEDLRQAVEQFRLQNEV